MPAISAEIAGLVQTFLSRFFASIGKVLNAVYSFRLADRELELKLRWLDLGKYLSKVGSEVLFDARRYLEALLNANAKRDQQPSFEAAVEIWQRKIAGHDKSAMRGHDYTDLLRWAISEFQGVKSFASSEAIERLFVLLSVEIADELSSELLEAQARGQSIV